MKNSKILVNVASDYSNSLFPVISMNDELKQIEYSLDRELQFFKITDYATNDELDEFSMIDNDIHEFYDKLLRVIENLDNWINNFERNQT